MEPKTDKTFSFILNGITLLTCFCSLAYGWGVVKTGVDYDSRRIDKIELAIIANNENTARMFLEIGILKEKIESLEKKIDSIAKK